MSTIVQGDVNSNIRCIEFFDDEYLNMCDIEVEDAHCYYGNGMLTHNSSIDFSGQEIRILTNMAKPKVFIEAFANGEDIHKKTAIAVWGEENYNKDRRSDAKGINFGIAYGATPYTFVLRGMSQKQADAMFASYWKAMPDLKRYQEALIKSVYRNGGTVYTGYGRPRRVSNGLSSSFRSERSAAERTILNTPIQGTGADLIRIILYDLYKNVFTHPLYRDKVLFAGTVHDEIVVYIKKDSIDLILPLLLSNMEKKEPHWVVPVVAEVELGTTFGNRFVFLRDANNQWIPKFI